MITAEDLYIASSPSNQLPRQDVSEGKTKPSTPTVEIEPKLELNTNPYLVSVDAEGIAELLRINGVPEEVIGKINIKIQEGGNLSANGTYDRQKKEIAINIGYFWKIYQHCLDIAEKISSGEALPRNKKFSELIKTKRLAEYLTKAPVERALEFAKKILEAGLEKNLNQTTLHEAKHAIDLTTQKKWVLEIGNMATAMLMNAIGQTVIYGGVFIVNYFRGTPELTFSQIASQPLLLLGGAITFQILTRYDVQPIERNARHFEELKIKDSKWHKLVTITPKNLKDTPLGRINSSKYNWPEE